VTYARVGHEGRRREEKKMSVHRSGAAQSAAEGATTHAGVPRRTAQCSLQRGSIPAANRHFVGCKKTLEPPWWVRVKLTGQLCDAPGVELVREVAADGSEADRPAACAGSLVTVCTEMGVDTSVGKKKTEEG